MNCYFDRSLAARYKSVSQQIRAMTEAWVAENIACPRCRGSKLAHLPQNTPLGDFKCPRCGSQYELKSKRGKVGRKIVGGSYNKCIERITGDNNPDWLVISYNAAELCVDALWFVPKHFFVPEIVERRKPLSERAKRKGWVGCNILFGEIPAQGRIALVSGRTPVARSDVERRVKIAERLYTGDLGARGWLMDVLACVNTIRNERFTLGEMYAFEPELQTRHPGNNNVRAKIRQQLQLLRDRGLLEFKGRGVYVKMTRT